MGFFKIFLSHSLIIGPVLLTSVFAFSPQARIPQISSLQTVGNRSDEVLVSWGPHKEVSGILGPNLV